MFPALVLTAGLGTRLRPLTELRAKPAVPVAGEPLARRIVRRLATDGVRDIVLNLHHLPATIAGIMGDGSDLGVRVRYSWEHPRVLGSAGGPRHALDLVGADTFFLVNGDTLTDVDLQAVAARHAASGALVTLALVPNVDPLHYGGVLVDGDGYVSGFVRRGPGARGSCHFIGVQVAGAGVFAGLPDNEPAASIGGAYDALLRRQPHAIAAHVSNARFWDIGTAADYLETSLAFAAAEGGGGHGRDVAIDRSALVVDSVLWDDVAVGPDCVVTRCILTDGVRLPRGSRYERAIVMPAAGGVSVTPLGE